MNVEGEGLGKYKTPVTKTLKIEKGMSSKETREKFVGRPRKQDSEESASSKKRKVREIKNTEEIETEKESPKKEKEIRKDKKLKKRKQAKKLEKPEGGKKLKRGKKRKAHISPPIVQIEESKAEEVEKEKEDSQSPKDNSLELFSSSPAKESFIPSPSIHGENPSATQKSPLEEK